MNYNWGLYTVVKSYVDRPNLLDKPVIEKWS